MVESIYQQEMTLFDRQLLRKKLYDFLQSSINVMMVPLVWGLYVYNGNTLDPSKIAITMILLSQVTNKINQLAEGFNILFGLRDVLDRLSKLYGAPEVQKGLVCR